MAMRILGVVLVLAVASGATDAVSDEEATTALAAFKTAFKTKDVEAKQGAVYNLHDYPNDLVLKELEKLLKNRDPRIRNVAALAVGGQRHNLDRAGKVLMNSYKKDFKNEQVVSSVLDGITELQYLKYWPEFKKAMKDERSSVVIRILELLGNNKDYRAFPDLVEMFKVAMPKRASWKTGSTSVDAGGAGDTDQKAAEAAFNKKYGAGGSKMKAAAKRRANSFDLRNFSTQLRKCAKQITGQSFDTDVDIEDWWVENYVMVAKKIAEFEGKDPESVVARAKNEQAQLRIKIDADRKELEEELAKQRGS